MEDQNLVPVKKKGNKTKKNGKGKETSIEVGSYYIPKTEWKAGNKISFFCKIDTIEDILKTLSDSQIKLFKEGPFGHILGYEIKCFPSQLMVHLLMRQCKGNDKESVDFNMGGDIVSFHLKDFALITGLKCHEYPILDESNDEGEIREKFFKNFDAVRKHDLKTVFNVGIDDDKMMVKLANLYMISCFLAPTQPHNIISFNLMAMLDDDELLKNYPWGRSSYERTIRFIKNIDTPEKLSKASLQGFPVALVIWAFETISKLSDPTCGFAMKLGEELPRILKWKSDYFPKWEDIQDDIFSANDFSFLPIIASDEEMIAEYFQYFVTQEVDEVERKYIEDQRMMKENLKKGKKMLVNGDGIKMTNNEKEEIDEQDVNEHTNERFDEDVIGHTSERIGEEDVIGHNDGRFINNLKIEEILLELKALKEEHKKEFETLKKEQKEMLYMLNNMMEAINDRLPQQKEATNVEKNKSSSLGLEDIEAEFNLCSTVDAIVSKYFEKKSQIQGEQGNTNEIREEKEGDLICNTSLEEENSELKEEEKDVVDQEEINENENRKKKKNDHLKVGTRLRTRQDDNDGRTKRNTKLSHILKPPYTDDRPQKKQKKGSPIKEMNDEKKKKSPKKSKLHESMPHFELKISQG